MAKLYFGALTRIALWILAAAIMVGLNVWVVVANYIACIQSFQLLGFENKDLGDDELVGPLFAAFVPKATVAHLLAGVFEAAVALAIWWLAHYLFSMVQLLEDRSIYVSSGDDASRRIVDHKLLFTAVRLVILAIPVAVAANTIVDLFRYRMIAQALGLEQPHDATMKISTFAIELQRHGNLFAWQIAKYGAWGLLCATLLVAICFELCCHKIAEASARLDALRQSDEPEQVPAGTEANEENNQPPIQQHPWEIPQPEADGNAKPEGPLPDTEETREVIGGKGKKVAVGEALANPHLYWVDPETRDIWDRSHHEEVVNARTFEEAAA